MWVGQHTLMTLSIFAGLRDSQQPVDEPRLSAATGVRRRDASNDGDLSICPLGQTDRRRPKQKTRERLLI